MLAKAQAYRWPLHGWRYRIVSTLFRWETVDENSPYIALAFQRQFLRRRGIVVWTRGTMRGCGRRTLTPRNVLGTVDFQSERRSSQHHSSRSQQVTEKCQHRVNTCQLDVNSASTWSQLGVNSVSPRCQLSINSASTRHQLSVNSVSIQCQLSVNPSSTRHRLSVNSSVN